MAIRGRATRVGGVDVVDTLGSSGVTLPPLAAARVLDGAVGSNGDAAGSCGRSHTSVTLVLVGGCRDDAATTTGIDNGTRSTVVAELGATVARADTVLSVCELAETAICDTTRYVDAEAALGGSGSSLARHDGSSRGCTSKGEDCGKHLEG